jgi:hypothetical protein
MARLANVEIKSTPNADIEQGHLSSSLPHLATPSYRLGNAKLVLDGTTETFVDNDDANQHLRLSYRDDYRMPGEV